MKLKVKDSKNLGVDSRRFVLNRIEDETGTSGTGVVAEGIQFSSGWVAMTWLSHHQCVNIYHSIETVKSLHGHNGKTKVVWIDKGEE